jgi:hypothetical protein
LPHCAVFTAPPHSMQQRQRRHEGAGSTGG